MRSLRPFFYEFTKGRYSLINNRKVAPNNVNDDLFNEKIPFSNVLVIDANGNQLGVKSKREALEIAYRQNLDLLCVAPKARPAVCKVLDYGKYHFEQQKKEKEAKRKQHTVELKSLRLSPVVDTHDFETKLRQVRKWIEQGMKVKIDMRFRGRMMTRQDVGRQIMNDFLEQVKDIAVVEKRPSLEGNIMSLVLAPQKKKPGGADKAEKLAGDKKTAADKKPAEKN
ncbi:MAG: translation initiation factor IF-3 [Allobaculum sp.]